MVLGAVVLLATFGTWAEVASAHQCPTKEQSARTGNSKCRDTPVYDDWRPNYVPLFDLNDRDDPETRGEAQRWREECTDDGDERQYCAWAYGGQSATPYPSDPTGTPRPNELHLGFAATHCFFAEAAHDCDRHEGDAVDEFGTHDSHGGAVYVDVCLSENPDSSRCDDGLADTQVGVTAVDHLDCPTGCVDEYHLLRPFDTEYTTEQMENSAATIPAIAADPVAHVCGYDEHSVCP